MSTTTTAPVVRNGVPVTKLFATIEKLTAAPELAAFRFTVTNSWLEGPASRSTISSWEGVGTEHPHAREFTASADHPTLGNGHGPTPQEYVLHALAACVTAGIATTAAARKVELESVETTVRGRQDVRGALAIDTSVRNGFGDVELDIAIRGSGNAEELAAIVESGRARSAVYDMLANETPIHVRVDA